MSIQDEVKEHMKEAMRSRDTVRLGTLRGVKTAFVKEMKRTGSETLPDDKCIKILRMLAKQRNESADLYTKGGREELAEVELKELEVIEGFLPSLAGEEKTREWVQDAIDTGVTNVGRLMGMVMKSHKGEADGKLVRRLVMEMLND